MPDWLTNFVNTFLALPRARQITLVATAAGSMAFFLWLSVGARTADYRLLYRGLEPAELAEIVDGLAAEKIEYEIVDGGSGVQVPASKIHEARMRLASRGLPNGSAPGFEIFDRGNFGVTDFVQKVNYNRALQGELARAIEQVEGVEKARVQLAVPERKALLRKDDRQPTASIITRLQPGWDLEASQVRGIVHLVASSVEGLDPSKVTLVDHRGRLLAPETSMSNGGAGSSAGMGAARRIEETFEHQIQSILERTVGMGRVVAKVNAELDWTQTEKTEEIFDPDSQVARSTQTDSEAASDGGGEGGVAGIVANSPDVTTAAGATGGGGGSSRSSETVNYEISKTVSRHVLPVGQIKRLSIAVLVDGKPLSAAPAGDAPADATAPTFEPWSSEELEEFEQIARHAVGFSQDRGDEITVLNAPFMSFDAEEAPAGWMTPGVLVLATMLLRGVGFLVALLLFAKFLIRPLADAVGTSDSAAVQNLRQELMDQVGALRANTQSMADGISGEPLAAGAGGMDLSGGLRAEDLEIPGLVEQSDEMTLQEQVDRLAQLRADDSVRTIRGWMSS